MRLPLLTRHADTLRYVRASGTLRLLDRHAFPGETRFVECVDVAAVVRAIVALDLQGGSPAAYAAGYGLALAARAWHDRPSDVRRGAIIQAGAALTAAQPLDAVLERIIGHCLARADAAILAGGDAEEAILSFIEGEIRRADKVAERCGRLAAELLDDSDRVLSHAFPGAALNWMLFSASAEQGKQLQLSTTETNPDRQGGRLAAHQAREIGITVAPLGAATVEDSLAQGLIGVYVAAATRIALDGSATGATGTSHYAALAKRHGVPVYILGYDVVDPAAATGADLSSAAPEPDVTRPELISAIITPRGVYRPEMIGRHLDGGEAPLDVIPLS
jgi:methylthioribose-1-phosphate isomerase